MNRIKRRGIFIKREEDAKIICRLSLYKELKISRRENVKIKGFKYVKRKVCKSQTTEESGRNFQKSAGYGIFFILLEIKIELLIL